MKNLEGVSLFLEFLLSLVIIVGGGVLMAFGLGDSQFVTAMIAIVIGFWFQSRSNISAVNNLLKTLPTNPTDKVLEGKSG